MCRKCAYNLIGGHVSKENDKPYCTISGNWLTIFKKECNWYKKKTKK